MHACKLLLQPFVQSVVRLEEKYSQKSALVHILYVVTKFSTFENLCHLLQRACLVHNVLQDRFPPTKKKVSALVHLLYVVVTMLSTFENLLPTDMSHICQTDMSQIRLTDMAQVAM